MPLYYNPPPRTEVLKYWSIEYQMGFTIIKKPKTKHTDHCIRQKLE